MKLFLSSLAISDSQAIVLAELVGKNQTDIKLALIENAADTYAADKRAWVDENRAAIESHGFDVEIIDIRKFEHNLPELTRKLAAQDVMWFGGGNCYYLRWLLKDIGLDAELRTLMNQSVVYGGGSAGAVVAGPTLKHFEPADHPADAPEVMYDGLGLIDAVVVPHIDNVRFVSVIQAIRDALQADGFDTVPLGDMQALVVDGDKRRVIG